MEKSKTLIAIETVIIVGATMILLSIPILAFRINNFEDGDHFANMLAPILTFGGSALVYAAFKAQIKANSQIQEQFKMQNFDQQFFRLIDNIERRITNSEIQRIRGEKIEKGFGILDYLVDEFVAKAESSSKLFGKQILLTNPECFNDQTWEKFYAEADGNKYSNWEILKNAFLTADAKTRSTILTDDIYKEYNDDYEKLLNDIFMEYFYEQSQDYYSIYYSHITKPYFDKYIVFLDTYYRAISMTLKHIDSIADNQFYIDYFKDNLTTYEKILIWIAVASRRFSEESRGRIMKINLLDAVAPIKGIKIAVTKDYLKHINDRLGK